MSNVSGPARAARVPASAVRGGWRHRLHKWSLVRGSLSLGEGLHREP